MFATSSAESQRIARLEAELGEERRKSAQLQEQLHQAQAQPQQRHYQEEQLYAALEKLEEDKRDFQERVVALEEENADLNSRCVMSSQQIRTQATQLNDKAAVIAQLEQEVEALQASVYEASASLDESMLEEANVTIFKWQESYQQLQADYYANYDRVMKEKEQVQEELQRVQARAEESERHIEKLSMHRVPVRLDDTTLQKKPAVEFVAAPFSSPSPLPLQPVQPSTPAGESAGAACAAFPIQPIQPSEASQPSQAREASQPHAGSTERGGDSGVEQTGLRRRNLQSGGADGGSSSGSGGSRQTSSAGVNGSGSGGSSKVTPLPPRTTQTSYCRLCFLLVLALVKTAILGYLVLYLCVALDLDIVLKPPLLPALQQVRDVHNAAQNITSSADLLALVAKTSSTVSQKASLAWVFFSSGDVMKRLLDMVLSLER